MRSVIWLIALSLFAAPAGAATLRIATAALPPSQGNPFTAIGQPSSVTWSAIFDALTRFAPDGQLEPALAVSWVAVTPQLWRFTLRDNATFHDGTPVTAEAVAASLELLRAPEGRKFYVASEVQNITALNPTGRLTLEIATRTPDAILPRRLSMVPIVAAHVWRARGEAGFAQAPVGTGPYRLTDWGQKSGAARLSGAPSWRKPAEMDALEIIPLEDPFSRLQALLSGRVDVAVRINIEDIEQAKSAGFAVASLPSPQVVSLTFRLHDNPNSPIADLRVRQALNLAIDRSAIARQIMLGSAAPMSQAATPETAGYNPDIAPVAFDPERAKALLAEAGHPRGFAFTAEVMVGASPADELIYQQAVQDLRRIGVTVTLRTITYPVWLRKYTGGDWQGADAFSLVWDSASIYDVVRPIANASCRKSPPFFCDQSLMPLLAAAESEMDEGRRLSALRTLHARLSERVPALWLVSVTHHYGLSPRLADVALRNSGVVYEAVRTKR